MRYVRFCFDSPRSFNAIILFLPLLLFFSTSLQALAANLFVSSDGSGTSCDQASPCSLETAVSLAQPLDSIYMAAATYTGSSNPMLYIAQDINIYGGWNKAASGVIARNPDLYKSIMDGEDVRRVIQIDGMITVLLDGFSIIRGAAEDGGAGISSQNADLTLNNIILDSNVVLSTSGEVDGGAGKIVGGSLTITDSLLRHNSTYSPVFSKGGGLVVMEATPTRIEGTAFTENDSWDSSGLYFKGASTSSRASITLHDNTFNGNGQGLSAGSSSGGYVGAATVRNAVAN